MQRRDGQSVHVDVAQHGHHVDHGVGIVARLEHLVVANRAILSVHLARLLLPEGPLNEARFRRTGVQTLGGIRRSHAPLLERKRMPLYNQCHFRVLNFIIIMHRYTRSSSAGASGGERRPKRSPCTSCPRRIGSPVAPQWNSRRRCGCRKKNHDNKGTVIYHSYLTLSLLSYIENGQSTLL